MASAYQQMKNAITHQEEVRAEVEAMFSSKTGVLCIDKLDALSTLVRLVQATERREEAQLDANKAARETSMMTLHYLKAVRDRLMGPRHGHVTERKRGPKKTLALR